MKKWMACLLCALILFPCAAMAVTHEDLSGYAIANGQIMAAEFVDVTAPCSGVLESFDLAAGDRVEEGQALFSMLTAKVTAGEKATVTWVFAAEGERADAAMQRYGAVVSMEPVQNMRIMASTDGAYSDEENRSVHVGEIVYFQSSKGDKEEGAGRIVSVSGKNYVVDILTGEFEADETLTLYRDDDYDNKEKVGRGSVIRRDPISAAGSGVIAEMAVEPGDMVEAGDVLFSLMGPDADAGADPVVCAPGAGVAANVAAAAGQQVWKGPLLARIFLTDEIEVVAEVDEVYLDKIEVGDEMYVTLDTDAETIFTGTVTEISALGMPMANASYYTVHLSLPHADDLLLGQSAKVYLPK